MKVVTKENFRVEITPKVNGYIDVVGVCYEEIARKDCEEIASQVNRHVDNIQYVEVKFDVKEYCSFCLNDWDVSLDNDNPEWPKGMPLCCDKAINEFKNLNKKEVLQSERIS